MTTVAFKDGVMACDSRITGGPLYTSKTKVIKGRDSLVGWCGDACAGYAGALYISGESQDRPETHRDDDVLFLIYRDGEVLFADSEFREFPLEDDFAAIGSGEMAAMTAMSMGATAAQAVKKAIEYDECSGGAVKKYTLK